MRNIHPAAYAPSTAPRTPPKPSKPHQPQPMAQEPEKNTDTPTPGAQQTMVLVVEDEESIAETLALIVADAGYTAIVASNGREALALARRSHPQLIITDLMMPYLNGGDLIAAVRSDAATHGYPSPRVMVVTAASRAIAEATGADEVVIKPFDVVKIEAAIQRLLQSDA